MGSILLLLPSLQAADTVVMLQARDGLGTAAAVADVALATIFLLILIALALLLFQLRGIHRTVRELGGRVERRLDPVLDRGRSVAANVEFISAAVRTDVQRVSDSVRSLSDRLQTASDRMEERIEEFNALMEVVQSEAEDIFVGSASAVRGVQAGARVLRTPKRREDPAADAELPPRETEPPAGAARPGPGAAPGGVQVTGGGQGGRRPQP